MVPVEKGMGESSVEHQDGRIQVPIERQQQMGVACSGPAFGPVRFDLRSGGTLRSSRSGAGAGQLALGSGKRKRSRGVAGPSYSIPPDVA
jgi:hypothetical protein